MPPRSFVRSVYCASPSPRRSRSLESIDWRKAAAAGPSTWSWPMCETSNAPAAVRTARCSGITPAYWTGISQPANGTILPPAATCRSWSAVLRRVAFTAATLAPRQRAGALVAQEARDVDLFVVVARARVEPRRRRGLLRRARRERGGRLDAAASRTPAAEAGGDHRDADVLAERVVDDG